MYCSKKREKASTVRAAHGLSYLPFVGRAVVDALHQYPHVNATLGDATGLGTITNDDADYMVAMLDEVLSELSSQS